jgi:hypothetical protein
MFFFLRFPYWNHVAYVRLAGMEDHGGQPPVWGYVDIL